MDEMVYNLQIHDLLHSNAHLDILHTPGVERLSNGYGDRRMSHIMKILLFFITDICFKLFP